MITEVALYCTVHALICKITGGNIKLGLGVGSGSVEPRST